jgi:hypothetical protein
MAKRTSLAERRAKDKGQQGGGVDAFFSAPKEPKTKKKSAPASRKKDERPAPTTVVSESLLKVSYYIRPEQDDDLLNIQVAVRRQTGEKRDKSALVREALDLLAQKYGLTSKPVNQ